MLPLTSGRGISVQRAPPSVDSIASSPQAIIALPAISAPANRGNSESLRRSTFLCLRPTTPVPLTAAKLAPAFVLRLSPVGPNSRMVLSFGASSAEGAWPPELRIDQVSHAVPVRH